MKVLFSIFLLSMTLVGCSPEQPAPSASPKSPAASSPLIPEGSPTPAITPQSPNADVLEVDKKQDEQTGEGTL